MAWSDKLDYDQTLVTAHEVGVFMDRFSLTRKNFQNNQIIIYDFLKELRRQIINLEGSALNMLQTLTGLPEEERTFQGLQRLVDYLNEGGLNNFANIAISKAQEQQLQHPRKYKGFKNINTQEIIQGLLKTFEKSSNGADYTWTKILKDTETLSRFNDFLFYYLEKAVQFRSQRALDKGLTQPKNIDIKVAVADLMKEIAKNKSKAKIKNSEIKKYLVLVVQLVSDSQNEQSFHSEFIIQPKLPQEWLDILDDSSDSLLGFYPYFQLSPREEQIASDLNNPQGAQVWDTFKKHILQLATSLQKKSYPKWQARMEELLNTLGPTHFFAPTLNHIKGIMGELQVAFMMLFVTGRVTMTGDMIGGTAGQKSAVDIVIGSPKVGMRGIQVKNVASYNFEGIPGWNLSKTYTLNTITNDILKDKGVDLAEFNEYMSVYAYNQPVKDASQAYRDLHQVVTSKNGAVNNILNMILAANFGYFFKLGDNIKAIYEGQIKNVFYVFGGTKIVPTSRILLAIFDKIILLEKQLQDGADTSFGNFRSTINIANVPHWNYGDKSQSIGDIIDKISVRMNFNIYLGDLNLSMFDLSNGKKLNDYLII